MPSRRPYLLAIVIIKFQPWRYRKPAYSSIRGTVSDPKGAVIPGATGPMDRQSCYRCEAEHYQRSR